MEGRKEKRADVRSQSPVSVGGLAEGGMRRRTTPWLSALAPALKRVVQIALAVMVSFAVFGVSDAQAQCGEVVPCFCGNGSCDPGENSLTCSVDCGGGGLCGNGVCDPGETIFNCSQDCLIVQPVCGDGVVEGNEVCDDGSMNGRTPCACASNCSGYPPLGANCNDGQFCTVNDSCNGAGSCNRSQPRSCPTATPNCSEQANQCVECTNGASCGALPNVQNGECSQGICVQIICDAGFSDCDGLNSNGCETGGSCSGTECGDGVCEGSESEASCDKDCFCGDGFCDNVEDVEGTCPSDCGGTCDGDGLCEPGENGELCSVDCFCGDGVCDEFEGEKTCEEDCQQCKVDEFCDTPTETSLNCQNECFCGDGVCDLYEEETGTCVEDCGAACNDNGKCEPGENAESCRSDCGCGDGVCDITEDPDKCSVDCEQCKLDGFCDSPDETSLSCQEDCACGDGVCDAYELEQGSCTTDCGDGTCQDDSDCNIPFGTARCDTDQGICKITDCDTDRGDCDGEYQNGCEATLGTVTRCANCSNNCFSLSNTTGEFCAANDTCGFSGCVTGFGDCDGIVSTGCEANTSSSTAHCGSCGNNCGDLPNVNATSCSSGTCQVDSCAPGFEDCNGNPADGCEVNTTTASNCGACGNDCLSLPHVVGASCLGGTSCGSLSCEGGFSNCNGQTADGCEADLGSPETCGFCGRDCTDLPNVATATCNGGDACGIAQCDAGFNDCDGDATNGCETSGACPFCGDGIVNGVDEECDDGNGTGGDGNGSTTCGCQADCTYAGMLVTCDDGAFCSGTDTCDGGGSCVSTGDPCGARAPYCDETNDECDECQSEQDCDNGFACDGDEVCTAAGTCGDGSAVICDTNELCLEPGGVCQCESGFVRDPDTGVCLAIECATAADCDVLNGPAPTCQRNTCVGQLCDVVPRANGTSCSDGSFCTGVETCSAGSCGTTGDPCAGDEVCDEGADRCVECTSTSDCAGGQVCNVGPGECVDCLSPSDCPAATNECQVAVCTASYTCSVGNVASGTSCTTDDNACNGPEECSDGACEPSGDDPCEGDTQNPVCIQTDNDTYACVGQCGDGIRGDGEECDLGTANSDDETQSGCSESCEINDGWSCSINPCQGDPEPDCGDGMLVGDETCDAGTSNGTTACGCQSDCEFAPSSETCDDGQFCTNSDLCDGTGQCLGSGTVCGGANPYCDESNDECDACLSSSDCVDALACNGTESCGGDGQCVAGSPVTCGSAEVCEEPSGSCVCQSGFVRDVQSGNCVPVECNVAADCGQAPACQIFSCVNQQCETANLQFDAACTNGNGVFCDGAESCSAGACVSPGDPCASAEQICSESQDRCVDCTSDADCGGDLCDVGLGVCVECLGDSDCSNGGNECRAATCSASGSCEISDLPTGTACSSDSNACNGAEECASGTGGIACRPTNENPCVSTPESPICDNLGAGEFDCLGSCGDGLLGNGEQCDLGVNNSNDEQDSACSTSCTLNPGWECPEGSACESPEPTCGDGTYLANFEECDTGSANGTTPCGCDLSCTYPPAIATCDDNLFCTDQDFCDGSGACVGSGATCPGGAAYCTEQSGGRCLDCVNASDCDDELACSGTETCTGGTCQSGQAVTCETNETCTEPSGTCACAPGYVVDPASGDCVEVECAVASDCASEGPAPVCQRFQCIGQLCSVTPVSSDARCDTPEFCDGSESCSAGSCVSSGDPCTGASGLCDESGDRCVECFSDTDCGGDGVCNVASGQCVECVSPSDCGAPQNECLVATCSAGGVCGTVNKPTGTSCSSDGLACNGEETCRPSGGVLTCRASGLNPCASDPANAVCSELGEGGFACEGVCGDGLLADDEACDLGSENNSNDPQVAGCSTSCEINVGWDCPEGADSCDEPETVCGDGILLSSFEGCDAGSANGTTPCGCDDSCEYPSAITTCDDAVFCTANDFCSGNGACVGSGQTCGGSSPYCDEQQDECLECLGTSDCTDDLFCTGTETCGVDGACVAGTPVACDTNETCTEAAQGCVCAPGFVRDGPGGACVASECVTASDCEAASGGAAPTCQAYVCENSLCSTVPVATDARCGNDTYCDGAEACDAGACTSSGNPCLAGGQLCDEDGEICVDCLSDSDCGGQRCDVDAGLCVECLSASDCPTPANECQVAVCGATGTCSAADKSVGTACSSDGLACNGAEFCDDSGGSIACLPEALSPCDTGSADPSCLEDGAGGFECVGSCGDGLLGTGETCDAGVDNTNDPQQGGCSPACEIHSGWVCESGDETCEVPVPDCGDGTVLPLFEDCDDGEDNGTTTCGCTTECAFAPQIASCDDGEFCTADDFCDGAGACVGSGQECGGDTPYCNESADVCFECSSQADCSDSLRCTGVETCGAGGSCVAGTPVACGANELCTEPTGACECAPGFVIDPRTLDCVAVECAQPADCVALFGDADVCQDYECNGQLCETVDLDVDVSCGNGLFCDGAEACQSGSCLSAGSPCSGGDVCDEGRDRCAECTSTSDCDGGLLCDGQRGVCVACLVDSDCPAGANECRAPSCSATGVCEYSNKPVGTACTSDGRACNGPEECTILGNGISCRPTGDVPCDTDSENPSCVELGNDQNSCVGRCGDGLLGIGESCDLGLDNNDDPQVSGCAVSCDLNEGWRCPGGADACEEPVAICGDGIVIEDVEACDAGEDNGTTDCGCTGSCTYVAASTSCNDGVYCNGLDSCDGIGQCAVHGGSPCALGDDACREETDTCDSCVTSADCDDALACNGTETCDRALGLCADGVPVDCSGDLVCNDMNGSCACPSGEAEVSPGVCEPIQCTSDSDCTDGNVCNGTETCDTGIGQCQAGTPIVCSNGLACDGRETCDPVSGCVDASDVVCQAGFECAEPDGQCVALCGDGVLDAGEECDDGVDNSDVLADACRTDCTAASCGDGVEDSGEQCDDDNSRPGDGCSANCLLEECVVAADCDAVGECSSASCLDGACFYNDLSRGTPCTDDELFCTGIESCDGDGVCESDGVPCANPAQPYCSEESDSCVECVDATDCDDGVFCNGAESCEGGACSDGSPAECELGSVCDSQSDACVSLCGNGICDDGIETFESCAEDCATGEEDTDGDGIADVVENQLGTLPGEKDSDGDGVADDVEVFDVSDPRDTDADGLINALDPDDDGDGIDTVDEDIDGDGDPTNDDTDGDGIPNYLDDDDDGDRIPSEIEAFAASTTIGRKQLGGLLDSDEDGAPNYLDDDDDNDTVLTADEVPRSNSSPWLEDTDEDGIPNYIDTDDDGDGLLTSDEVNDFPPDFDGDGVPNHLDVDDDDDDVLTANEVTVYSSNPYKEDTDDDLLLDGDEVELGTTLTNPDTDNDGLLDGEEVQINSDPLDDDTDDDGLLDGEEVEIGTGVRNPDSDDDELLDGEEVNRYGTLPLDEDTDDDGLLDGEEVRLGLDPLNPDSDGDGIPDGQDVGDAEAGSGGCQAIGSGAVPLIGILLSLLGVIAVRRRRRRDSMVR